MSISKWLLGGCLLLGACAAPESAHPTGPYGLGQPISQAELAPWDIDVKPDGTGLPPGSATALQGEPIYQEKCASCHGVFAQGVHPYGGLEGGVGSLDTTAPLRTLGSFWPYGPVVFDYIRRTMPFNRPQSLNDREVYALTAYLLYLNGIIEEDQSINQETLAQVEMPNRNGFVGDPRPDTDNHACMNSCLEKN